MVWSGVYDAFGNCQVMVDEAENNLRLPGQYYDKETGLYYNLNRYYDPKTGRYLQTDPAGDGLNPYLYAAANPVNFVDPDGLWAFRMVGGIADIGVGLLLTAKTGGIGLVVAWGLIINGADNLVAGAYSMIAGEEIPSLIQGGFRRAIPNRTAADLAYMGFEIGLNVAGLAVERAAMRAAQQVGDEFGDAIGASLNNPHPNSHGFSIRNINPKVGDVGRIDNCANCAIATDLMLGGRRSVALPGGIEKLSFIEKVYNKTFKLVYSVGSIESELRNAGPGARGIVAIWRGHKVKGHVLNAVNQKGIIRFLDGQRGKASKDLSEYAYKALLFLRTN